MNVKEAASILGISPQAVRTKCRRGELKARMKADSRTGKKSWVISDEQVKKIVEPVEPRLEETAGGEGGKPADSDAQGAGGVRPDPVPAAADGGVGLGGAEDPDLGSVAEDEEERWQRILREEEEDGAGAEGVSSASEASRRVLELDPSQLRKLIKGHMPKDMWERNEFLLNIWCEIAPEYIKMDLEKVGKVAFYGIPVIIAFGEGMRARRIKMAARAAQAEASA